MDLGFPKARSIEWLECPTTLHHPVQFLHRRGDPMIPRIESARGTMKQSILSITTAATSHLLPQIAETSPGLETKLWIVPQSRLRVGLPRRTHNFGCRRLAVDDLASRFTPGSDEERSIPDRPGIPSASELIESDGMSISATARYSMQRWAALKVEDTATWELELQPTRIRIQFHRIAYPLTIFLMENHHLHQSLNVHQMGPVAESRGRKVLRIRVRYDD
ncbi:hypothetical protein K440DRAFT_635990 [Wilcoxina mikolae CBS 423.85]|nr:hypothetical protein K440DRAFT_635990 [Wilcoxina mikolae CBS 423.85]